MKEEEDKRTMDRDATVTNPGDRKDGSGRRN